MEIDLQYSFKCINKWSTTLQWGPINGQEDLLPVSCRHCSCLNFSLQLWWGASWHCHENADVLWESQRASLAVWVLIHSWQNRSKSAWLMRTEELPWGGITCRCKPYWWREVLWGQPWGFGESARGCHSKYIKLHIHFTTWVVKMGMNNVGETSSPGSRCSGEILELFRAWCSGIWGLFASCWGQKVIRKFSTLAWAVLEEVRV